MALQKKLQEKLKSKSKIDPTKISKMEELLAYLEPVQINPKDLGVSRQASLYNKVTPLHRQNGFNTIGANDIVILGVNESRNCTHPSKQNSPNVIRQYLYGLSTIKVKENIFDAGNLVETKTPAQTYKALEDTIDILNQKNAIIIVIGGTQELTEIIYRGIKRNRALISLSVIDSHIDLDNDPSDFHASNYLNKLYNENLLSLFDLSIIGYQGYFVDSQKLDLIRNKNFELLRLGFVRGNYREVEPTLRNSDIVSFDLGAIRSSDSPGNFFPSPNGLYAEESCQLTRYAGTSDKTSCLGIFEYHPEKDVTGQSALMAAQLIWHFIDGVAIRKKEVLQSDSENIKKFIVNSGTPGIDIIFYKSEESDNWWFEIPTNSKFSKSGTLTIPCSPLDYIAAGKEDIPERWLRFYQKVQSKI